MFGLNTQNISTHGVGLSLQTVMSSFYFLDVLLETVLKILLLIAYVQKPPLSIHAEVSRGRGEARVFFFYLSIHLYLSRVMLFPTMWHFDKCRLR